MSEYLKDCLHRNYAWVERTFSDGSKHHGKQCLFCGLWKSAKKEIVAKYANLNDLRAYDDGIREEYNRNCSEARQIAYQKELKERRIILSEYYETEHWKAYRRFRHDLNKQLFNGFCEMCRSCQAEHIHHLTYERMYHELPFDTAAVCERCHTTEHPHMTVE